MLFVGVLRELEVNCFLNGRRRKFVKPTLYRLSMCDVCACLWALLQSRNEVNQ
jgi:hypothetical protein